MMKSRIHTPRFLRNATPAIAFLVGAIAMAALPLQAALDVTIDDATFVAGTTDQPVSLSLQFDETVPPNVNSVLLEITMDDAFSVDTTSLNLDPDGLGNVSFSNTQMTTSTDAGVKTLKVVLTDFGGQGISGAFEGTFLTFDVDVPDAVGDYPFAFGAGTFFRDTGFQAKAYTPNDGTISVVKLFNANDDADDTLEDTPVEVDVLANDSDEAGTAPVAGATVTQITADPANGTVTIAGDGSSVTYTPNLNYNGQDTFTYEAQDPDGNTDTGEVTVTVTPVNDPPTFAAGAEQTVNEDAGQQDVVDWATAINAGAPDEAGQNLNFTVTNDNNDLFTGNGQPGITPNGLLRYTPAADANGTATVTVTLSDNGGSANGGVDTSAPQTFTITLNPVNDAPSFWLGVGTPYDPDAFEDQPQQTVDNWASHIKAGPADESNQALTFNVATDNPDVFSVLPAIDPASGDLTYTPATTSDAASTDVGNGPGVATVTVSLNDDGGTANGGEDTSADKTFTITITPRNDEHVIDDIQITDSADLVNGGAIDVTVSATDEETAAAGLEYTYEWSSGGTNIVTRGPTAGAATDQLTEAEQAGLGDNYPITCSLSVSDGTITLLRQVNTFVGNQPPALTAEQPAADPSIDEGDSQDFTVTFNDAGNDPQDDGIASIIWSLNTNGAGFVEVQDAGVSSANGPASDSYTFTTDQDTQLHAGGNTYVVRAEATDGQGVTRTRDWTVTVNDVNSAPTVAIDDITASANLINGGDITVNVTGADDDAEDQGNLQYTYVWTSGDNLILGPPTATATLTVAQQQAAGFDGPGGDNYPITCEVTVEDTATPPGTDTDTASTFVGNLPPQITDSTPDPAVDMMEGDAQTFTITATDQADPSGDDGIKSIEWSVTGIVRDNQLTAFDPVNEGAANDSFTIQTDNNDILHADSPMPITVTATVTDGRDVVETMEWTFNLLDKNEVPTAGILELIARNHMGEEVTLSEPAEITELVLSVRITDADAEDFDNGQPTGDDTVTVEWTITKELPAGPATQTITKQYPNLSRDGHAPTPFVAKLLEADVESEFAGDGFEADDKYEVNLVANDGVADSDPATDSVTLGNPTWFPPLAWDGATADYRVKIYMDDHQPARDEHEEEEMLVVTIYTTQPKLLVADYFAGDWEPEYMDGRPANVDKVYGLRPGMYEVEIDEYGNDDDQQMRSGHNDDGWNEIGFQEVTVAPYDAPTATLIAAQPSRNGEGDQDPAPADAIAPVAAFDVASAAGYIVQVYREVQDGEDEELSDLGFQRLFRPEGETVSTNQDVQVRLPLPEGDTYRVELTPFNPDATGAPATADGIPGNTPEAGADLPELVADDGWGMIPGDRDRDKATYLGTGSANVNFSWNPIEGADYYRVVVLDEAGNGAGGFGNVRVNGTQISGKVDAAFNGFFRWHVIGVNETTGTTNWSPAYWFKIEPQVEDQLPAVGTALANDVVTISLPASHQGPVYVYVLDVDKLADVPPQEVVIPQTELKADDKVSVDAVGTNGDVSANVDDPGDYDLVIGVSLDRQYWQYWRLRKPGTLEDFQF